MYTYLKIISMNVNGKNDGRGSANRRKKAIHDIVDEYEPHIVFFQEFKWKRITGSHWGLNALLGTYHRFPHDDTSIMIDKQGFSQDCENIRTEILQHAKLHVYSVSPEWELYEACYSIKIVKNPDKNIRIICMSWHGPHTGYTDEKKIDYFHNLMMFIISIKEQENLPMIVAGDFNISRDLISEYVLDPFKLVEYDASERRNLSSRGVIDFMLVTYDFKPYKAEWINLETDTDAQNPLAILDHDPIKCSLKYSDTYFLDKYLKGINSLKMFEEPEETIQVGIEVINRE